MSEKQVDGLVLFSFFCLALVWFSLDGSVVAGFCCAMLCSTIQAFLFIFLFYFTILSQLLVTYIQIVLYRCPWFTGRAAP